MKVCLTPIPFPSFFIIFFLAIQNELSSCPLETVSAARCSFVQHWQPPNLFDAKPNVRLLRKQKKSCKNSRRKSRENFLNRSRRISYSAKRRWKLCSADTTWTEERQNEDVRKRGKRGGERRRGHDAFKTFVPLPGPPRRAPERHLSRSPLRHKELWSMKVSKVHLHQNTKANISWASDPIFRSPWSFSLVVLWEWRAVYLPVVCLYMSLYVFMTSMSVSCLSNIVCPYLSWCLTMSLCFKTTSWAYDQSLCTVAQAPRPDINWPLELQFVKSILTCFDLSQPYRKLLERHVEKKPMQRLPQVFNL